MMRQKLLTTLPLVGALTFAAQAHATTIHWTLGGDGNVSGYGTLTYGPDPVSSDPSNASAITNITGFFSDNALGFTSAIKSLAAISPSSAFKDPLAPASFGWYPSVPASDPGTGPTPYASYDDLFYADGASPIACNPYGPDGYPFDGGFFDIYGVVFTLQNGDSVDLWSNGNFDPSLFDPSASRSTNNIGIYGVKVTDGGVGPLSLLDNGSSGNPGGPGLTFAAVPEPSTWAMMALGFAGLGFAGYRKQSKNVPVAT